MCVKAVSKIYAHLVQCFFTLEYSYFEKINYHSYLLFSESF